MLWGLLVLAACRGPTPPPPATAAELELELRSFLDRYRDAFAQANPDAVAALYAPDVQWVERGQVAYTSVDDIVKSLASIEDPGTTRLDPVFIRPIGNDGAYLIVQFDSVFDGFSFGGWLTLTVERDRDGWRIVGGSTTLSEREG